MKRFFPGVSARSAIASVLAAAAGALSAMEFPQGIMGVNYYAPMAHDYHFLAERGGDAKTAIRRDVAHLRRLGMKSIRIHVTDRQVSDADGGLVDNVHLDLLDYLASVASSNGIGMVYTPISWWSGRWNREKRGFAERFSMKQLASNRKSWPVQARFLREFASHVNRYTGFRYADDPSTIAFECINEPVYPANHPDSEVRAYIDTLVEAIRSTGTKKPIYYNSWHGRNAVLDASSADGATGSCYPTGTMNGRALFGSQLGHVVRSTLAEEKTRVRKPKMIYEFDAADTPGAYLYPAFARMFRSEGVDAAHVFSYDLVDLADENMPTPTHYLNLVYTPAKAISLAIAAEVMARTEKGAPFKPDAKSMAFGPFRVDASRNLSEMATDACYMYSADPVTPPPSPEKLKRVWGVGKSSVAASSGNGAYFLDRVRDGMWRLQLYPSIREIADPYTYRPRKKRVVLADKIRFSVNLPGIGRRETVLDPGDYVVTRAGFRPANGEGDAPPYYAPPPATDVDDSLFGEPGVLWEPCETGRETIVKFEVRCDAAADGRYQLALELDDRSGLGENVSLRPGLNRVTFMPDDMRELWKKPGRFLGRAEPDRVKGARVSTGAWLWNPLPVPADKAKVVKYEIVPCSGRRSNANGDNLFDARAAVRQTVGGMESCRTWRAFDPQGRPACRYEVPDFVRSGRYDAAWTGVPVDGASFAEKRGRGKAKRIIVRARAGFPQTTSFQLRLKLAEGELKFNIPVTTEWRDVVREAEFDLADLQKINLCFGKWLYPKTAGLPHGFEIEGVRVE